MKGTYSAIEGLIPVLGAEKVRTNTLDRVAYSCDASLYQLIPRAVVHAESVEDIRRIFAWSRQERIPITFRAAGTSLSGQAVTEHVLVNIQRGFDVLEITKTGDRVRAGCSLRGGYVNVRLRHYHRRIGPDPASIDACTIGGIVANNASGMCCGITQNSYHTLRALTCVLPSGTVLDTRDIAAADALLAEQEPTLYSGLIALRDGVRGSHRLASIIRHRARLKNTMGYSLAAFLDFERPADILQHLLVGSEGTLAFIADVTLETVPQPPHATTALFEFSSLRDACHVVEYLASEGAAAIELMDGATLKSMRHHAQGASFLDPDAAAALLVEFLYDDPHQQQLFANVIEAIRSEGRVRRLLIAGNQQQRLLFWQLRKGAMPSVGAARARISALINEDVAFPRHLLSPAIQDLQQLLARYHFNDAVIFGHARDGNMHFAFSLDTKPESIEYYAGFMHELAVLVTERYDGSLKAEHGTGRNMAPYLHTQWGDEAVELMWRIKELFDPYHLLNPDVILTHDKTIHLRDIKQLPEVDRRIDPCIECGFCERICPSAGLTLTPRQRIIVAREIHRRMKNNDVEYMRDLNLSFEYAGITTCAADGLCMRACPVGINTGDWIVTLRGKQHREIKTRLWSFAAQHPSVAIAIVGYSLHMFRALTAMTNEKSVEKMSFMLGQKLRVPSWLSTMGIPDNIHPHCPDDADIAYLPSCMAYFGGQQPDGSSPTKSLVHLAHRIGKSLAISTDVGKVCCGHPWHSNGMEELSRTCLDVWIRAAKRITKQGTIPLALDSSSCVYMVKTAQAHSYEIDGTLEILDPYQLVDRWADQLQKCLRRSWRIVFHPPCSLTMQGHSEHAISVLEKLGCQVIVPYSANCCGMAGHRGLMYPEIPDNALTAEIHEISLEKADLYVTTNLPCQWMLSRKTGKSFISLWQAIEYITR